MGDAARHVKIWRFLQCAARWLLMRAFRFQCQTVDPGMQPCLVVANHNVNLDPALIALSFPKKQLYFVASEHVFRKGFPSKLLHYFFAPISRIKGSTDVSAAMEIIRTLHNGSSVCLFAEGNRSFNGVTGPVSPATSKLAKRSGAALVTYKFEGGYLTSPRWSRTLRKGRMLGYCVNVYSPEQLKGMTTEEVNRAIEQDLREDAFERQAAEPIDYIGKHLAEGLETALYLCPKCGRIGTLHSRDDRFFCDCGLQVTYTTKGFFTGAEVPFSNIRDWDRWQTDRMIELSKTISVAPAFSDDGMSLYRVEKSHTSTALASGTLAMNQDSLMIGGHVFALDTISSMALVGSCTIVFTADSVHYELRADARYYCGRKYFALYQLLKN
ncbi:MAG: lysophospholipid acyltransferase family protein [Clostridia bacterium]